MASEHKNFGEDLAFLEQHSDAIKLAVSDRQQIVVVPQWQGRTMTSTADGDRGFSYGWVNYQRINDGKIQPQINLFGGEDRFWVGPEGSQYSFFFDPGQKMELDNWRTPPEIDTHPFDLVEVDADRASFRKQMRLANYQGNEFDMLVQRKVQMHSDDATSEFLGLEIPSGVLTVCHESENRITNSGETDWQAELGLPAAWMLCMNKPSDQATVIVPFLPGSLEERGKIVTSDYFGKLDSRRLRICDESNLIFFKGDGQLRSKLGVAFGRAKNYLGAWDARHGCLTVVQFNLPEEVQVGYTNNLWKHVDNPYAGDVINSYNDGPNKSGGRMGPFYELETLSPALPLKSGESWSHQHRTIHVQGDRAGVELVARHVFGVDFEFIESVF